MSALLGQFTIDPTKADEFRLLCSLCQEGSIHRCLIGTLGNAAVKANGGSRLTARRDPDTGAFGIIGVTYGDLRYERLMTDDEIYIASHFDLGLPITRKVTITIDLNDPSWGYGPKRGREEKTTTRRPNRNGSVNRHKITTVRKQYLDKIRQEGLV